MIPENRVLASCQVIAAITSHRETRVMDMAKVDDVAAAVIERMGATFGSTTIDTFKLQKLVYYCQAWHLVWDEEELFDSPIEAWAGGPVVPDLYYRHRTRYSVSDWPWGDPSSLSKSERATIALVVDSYGKLTGRRLSYLTHKEEPWRTARGTLGPGERGSSVIETSEMADYYGALDQDEDAEPIDAIAATDTD
jgi:uncharacterized phage-associated protein